MSLHTRTKRALNGAASFQWLQSSKFESDIFNFLRALHLLLSRTSFRQSFIDHCLRCGVFFQLYHQREALRSPYFAHCRQVHLHLAGCRRAIPLLTAQNDLLPVTTPGLSSAPVSINTATWKPRLPHPDVRLSRHRSSSTPP